MAAPVIRSVCLCGVAIFMMTFKNAGDEHEGHEHTFHHPSIVCRGSATFLSNGLIHEFDEYNNPIVAIPAGVRHTIIAKEANTRILCVQGLHSKENPGDIIDEDMVPRGTPLNAFVPVLLVEAFKQGFGLHGERTDQIAKIFTDAKV